MGVATALTTGLSLFFMRRNSSLAENEEDWKSQQLSEAREIDQDLSGLMLVFSRETQVYQHRLSQIP